MNNKNQEIRNPALVEAMAHMIRNNTAKNRSLMAEALLSARLLSPIRQQTVLLETSGPSSRVKFEEIQNTQGDAYYMAFTDMDEYNKWNEDGSHDKALIMTMNDFGNILLRNVNNLKGFVINPYGENVSITKPMLLSLLKQWEIHAKKAQQAN